MGNVIVGCIFKIGVCVIFKIIYLIVKYINHNQHFSRKTTHVPVTTKPSKKETLTDLSC